MTKYLIVGPKHNGMGRYIQPLYSGLRQLGLDVDWVGTNKLLFTKDEILKTAKELFITTNFEEYDLIHFQLGMYDLEQSVLLWLPDKLRSRTLLTAHSIVGRIFEKSGCADLDSEINNLLRSYFSFYIFFGSHSSNAMETNSRLRKTLFFPSTHQFTKLTTEKEDQIRSKFKLFAPFLCLPGYASPWKDHGTLLEALGKVNLPINFVFAGPRWGDKLTNHPYINSVQIIDKELDEFEFLFMIRNTLFGILPYQDHFTNSGNGVISNYLWEGKAVIVTDALCLPEYVADSGIVIPQHDPNRLAQAIEALYNNQIQRAELERLAKHRAERFFSWEKHIAEHMAIYEYITKQ